MLLQPRNDVFIAVQIDERLSAFRRVQKFASLIAEAVIDRDNPVFLDIHTNSFRVICFYNQILQLLTRRLKPDNFNSLYYNNEMDN